MRMSTAMEMGKWRLREPELRARESQTRRVLERRMAHPVDGSRLDLSTEFTWAGAVRPGGRPYEEKLFVRSGEFYFAPSTK